MKRILIMESGSLTLRHIKPNSPIMKGISIVDSFKVVTGKKVHGTLGGAAKASYQLYRQFSSMKNCNVDFFADFSAFTKKRGIGSTEELMQKNYDIIFMNSTRDALLIDEYIKKNRDTKTVYTDRNNSIVNFSNIRKFHPRNPAIGYLLFQMRGWLSCFVGITEEQEEKAHRFFKKHTKVCYIPIAPDKDYRKLNAKRTFKGAIYVGRLDERQKKLNFMINGIDRVIDGNSKFIIHNKMLKVVGSGPHEGQYKQLVKQLGLERNIVFKGALYGDDLIKEYNNASFFVSTSEWESPGRTFLEAIACGLPVLNNTMNNSNGIIKNKYNGLVYKYGDIEDFAEKFYFLYSNRKIREQMAKNAINDSKKYSIDKSMAMYKKIVDSL